jgi:hypothetical protein
MLMEKGIKPSIKKDFINFLFFLLFIIKVWVFDGKPPELKREELKRRK